MATRRDDPQGESSLTRGAVQCSVMLRHAKCYLRDDSFDGSCASLLVHRRSASDPPPSTRPHPRSPRSAAHSAHLRRPLLPHLFSTSFLTTLDAQPVSSTHRGNMSGASSSSAPEFWLLKIPNFLYTQLEEARKTQDARAKEARNNTATDYYGQAAQSKAAQQQPVAQLLVGQPKNGVRPVSEGGKGRRCACRASSPCLRLNRTV